MEISIKSFGSVAKKIGGWILIAASVGILSFSIYFFVDISTLPYPGPYLIDFSNFSGQILPAQRVHPRTFTVETDFSEVDKWGEGSILSYLVTYDNNISVEAWNPIAATPGVFKHAQKNFPLSSDSKWWGFKIKRVSQSRNTLIVFPARRISPIVVFSAFGLLISLLPFFAGKSLCFPAKPAK